MTGDESFTVSPVEDTGSAKKPGPKPGAKAAKGVAMEGSVPENANRVSVKFLEASGPGGSDRVTLCINGVIYSYARNEIVEVPDFVLEAADNAAPMEMDPRTGNMRAVPRFPYHVVR